MFSRIRVMQKLPARSFKHEWEQKSGREATNEGIIQCLNLAGNHPYGVLALLIAPTCILVLLTKYCHFLMNLHMHVISKSLLFLPNQAWAGGRNVLFISEFLTGAICGSSPTNLSCWRRASSNHRSTLLVIGLPSVESQEYQSCQSGSLKDCFY